MPSEVDPDTFNLDLWRAIAQHCSLQDSIDEVFHVSHAKMVVSGKWCLEDPHPHSQDSSD